MCVLQTIEDLDAAWLAEALGLAEVGDVRSERVGTGQMSQNHRVTFTADGEPRSVVLKLASEDVGSRATGVGMGAYMREVRFYRELAPRLESGPIAACAHSALDEAGGWFTLVLEDVAPAVQGDQIEGCDPQQATRAMEALAEIHHPFVNDPQLAAAAWINGPNPLNQALLTQLLPGFIERYDQRVSPAHRLLTEEFVRSADGWLDAQPKLRGLVHGDYRLDNMLWGEPSAPRPLTVVDWQTISFGSPLMDVSYFLGISMEPEQRREHEERLVRTYYDALGAEGLAWEECWDEYRRMVFHAIVMSVAASMLVERTERGDDMFMASLSRSAQQAIDLDSTSLLPKPSAPAPLRPEPEDEGRHPATSEEWFNESWYFDAVDESGELGAYVRMGLVPNQGATWLVACACRPGRPTVMAVDSAAPLPEDGQLTVRTSAIHFEQTCDEPLERYTVKVRASARAFSDPAAPLRGEEGEPAELELDLTWQTDGEPYQYRLATRYEIPCAVTGTIRIDGEQLRLSGTGQRDHSWGSRDWWSMDWVWSAAELDDGARLHGVALRLPGAPPLAVGYVQAGGELTELDRVDATEEVTQDGLISSARLELQPAGVQVELEPLAFGALRLQAPDGRLSFFPRAMCRFTAADGHSGLGWAEWNMNQ